MNEQAYEQVKAMVGDWDEEWGCGPYEDCLPEEEELQTLNELTGQSWEAEDVRDACFEYTSHNSLEETAYFLFHGDYPPVTNIDMAFWKLKSGAVPDPKTVYETYCLGKQLKALLPLPMEEITAAFRALPGWREYERGESHSVRFDCLDQPDAWSDVHFWLFWYGGRKNPRPDHLLRLSCHNLTDGQLQTLLDVLEPFGLSFQYREEDHAY